MKAYDTNLPLFSIHIPKTAGTSLASVLEHWFPDRFYRHYHDEVTDTPPAKVELKPGSCIHGHFPKISRQGVLDYYPDAVQFITFVRDPFEVAVSAYFHYKRNKRRRLENGKPYPVKKDFSNISDFLKNRHSSIANFIPSKTHLSLENVEEALNRFVYVGLVEDMQNSADQLAFILGKNPVVIQNLNVSPRDEEVPKALRSAIAETHPLDYAIYEHAKKTYHRTDLANSAPNTIEWFLHRVTTFFQDRRFKSALDYFDAHKIRFENNPALLRLNEITSKRKKLTAKLAYS